MSMLLVPGAEHVAGPHSSGGNMAGGPSRITNHITWDAVDPHTHKQIPSYDEVKNYLVNVGYEPTLTIDPFSGRIAQYFPANRSGYALMHQGSPETNRMGDIHIQVEWYFSPGIVHKGVRYDDLSQTPMRGMDEVRALCASWGIPEVWPLGIPQWQGSSRDPHVWSTEAGWYGHCHVPGNTHSDPGPMSTFTGASAHIAHLLHKAKYGPLTAHEIHELNHYFDPIKYPTP